jgi:microcompartment protein CcmL/EutN
VQAAVEAGVNVIKDEGLLIRFVVIPQLHEDMRQHIV